MEERERDLTVTSKLKGGEGVKAIKVESDLGLIEFQLPKYPSLNLFL